MGYADRVPNRAVMSEHQPVPRVVPILGSTDYHLAVAVLARSSGVTWRWRAGSSLLWTPMPCHQPRLDRFQFAIHRLELACQHAEQLARQCRHTFPGRQTLQQLDYLVWSFGCCNAEFRRMAAQRIHQHRALLDQQVAHPEHRQRRLLLGGFDRHKPHRRPAHRFANRLGIDRVVLAALDVALDILRRHQQHRVPQAAQQPRPVMRGAARLDADSRRWQLGKEFLDLAAPQLPPQYRLLVLVNSMNLKDMFGRVQTNSDNRHSDGSSWLRCSNLTAWHIRCRRGPSTPTELEPCAVHQQVNRFAAGSWSRHRQSLAS